MIERIYIENSVCATVIRSAYQREGIEFFTNHSDTIQLGYMNRAKGYKIPPHIHNSVPRTVEFTNEVLFIKSGRVRVDFYGMDYAVAASVVLTTGDVILLTLHGHGFEMLEDTEMIEVKQGPYVGESDKVRINP